MFTNGLVFVKPADDASHYKQALCTEAALNAIQRKYPQIYKTSDRLAIKPAEIDVIARDFIISAKSKQLDDTSKCSVS